MKLRWPAPQVGRRSSSSGRASVTTKIGWLPRPVEQVLDEVEQARVRPLHVLEGEHRRIALGQALEEEAPGGEQVLLVASLVRRRARADVRVAARGTHALPCRGCAPRAWRAAWRVQTPAPLPRRCGSACAPCPRAPSRSRPRRRRGSGRGASRRCRRCRRSTCRTPTTSRDLPIPAMPVTETRCAFARRREAWKRSLIWRSSRSRPTNGGSSPCDLSEPRKPETTRCAFQSWCRAPPCP